MIWTSGTAVMGILMRDFETLAIWTSDIARRKEISMSDNVLGVTSMSDVERKET